MQLSAYAPVIKLFEPYERPQPLERAAMPAALDYLLSLLAEEGRPLDKLPVSYQERRRLLRALLNERLPRPGDEDGPFFTAAERFFWSETLGKRLQDARALPQPLPGLALWRGDITELKIDAVVNAANSALLGCLTPLHDCIDNAIHSAAGPRLRADCARIIELQGHAERTGEAKLTRAYALPACFVLHTVGPIIHSGWPAREHEAELAACYRACLDLARESGQIRSLAFCCISTGVFGYPKAEAARLAVRTVREWLADHPASLDIVVFNVFKDQDEVLYRTLLA